MSTIQQVGDPAGRRSTAATFAALDPHADPLARARAELTQLVAARPGHEHRDYPSRPRRPLGVFSDYVAQHLGAVNEQVRIGAVEPQQLLDDLEHALSLVDPDVLTELSSPHAEAARSLACLDLAWAERSTAIAFGSTDAYKTARADTLQWRWLTRLAQVEQRHGLLCWSDIAIHHPMTDPRSFLTPGPGRDQEVFMYRVQGACERMSKALVQRWPTLTLTPAQIDEVALDLSLIAAAMAHLVRVREVGEFYKLDPFLGPNDEVRGHGTGAFSAWSFLIAFLITGDEEFRHRLCDPDNLAAFDPDARSWIRLIAEDRLTPLPVRAASVGAADLMAAADNAQRRCRDFHKAHRGGIRRHAPTSMPVPAPANPAITNEESINRAANDRRRTDRPQQ